MIRKQRMAMEEHRDWVVAKVDVRNAHNEIWRSAIISALEAEPTLQHLAWFAAVVLAPPRAENAKIDVKVIGASQEMCNYLPLLQKLPAALVISKKKVRNISG